MKIDFLVGDNPYGTTVHFAKGYEKALQEFGVKTRLFWIADGYFFHAFYEMLADPPNLTCSFSDISLEGNPLGSLWSIPHLSMLVDPPIYFLHQLKGERSWVSCVDQKDCAFVQKLGCKQSFFLPHAVDVSLHTEVNKERPYEVAFFGTCVDYKAVEEAWREDEREVLKAAAKQVLSPDGVSILEALVELGVQQGELARMHHLVDLYTRGKDRVKLIQTFEGYQVHIWGDGPWKKYVPNAHICAPVAFEKTFKVMQQSQLVLNSSPRFKSGSHERIFYALACGANVYSGENPYLKEQLPHLATYRHGEWSPLDRKNWQEIARNEQQNVLANHTYHARTRELLTNIIDHTSQQLLI